MRYLSIVVFAFLFSNASVLGQSEASASPQLSRTPEVPRLGELEQTVRRIAADQAELEKRLASAERESIALRAQLDTATGILEVTAGFIAVVLAIGTFASLFGFIRSERRAAEAHKIGIENAVEAEKRAGHSFQLAVSGESASQNRAAEVHEKFLSGSRETLDLVNATLNLAKEASERAARTVETRARLTIDELDQASQSLLASVPAQDDRALIANPATRSTLRSLAQKISGFEINRFLLPDTLQLTPACVFIRGMDFHLNQQFDDALRNWQTVALSPNASQSLKSLAWYWIGYEQNNLNRFNEAEQSFENAAQHSQGIGGNRRFELQRILLETRFFNKERYRAESLVVPFEQLLVSIDKESPSDERDARRIKILVTLANVTYRSGKDAIMAADGHETAKTRFARARELYSQAAPKDKWAQFGLAEILNLSDVDADRREALAIFKRVRQDAIDESVRREEPRTKVLARTTELVCCLRVPEFKQEVSAIRSLVLQELGRVDERLTVYSQIQRRNVTKTAFQDDLEDLISREVQGGQRSQSA